MTIITQPVIQIIGKRRALLKEDYVVNEDFTIPAGFQFDGATMPSWTWSLLRLDPFGRISGAALPHDLLYANCGCVRGRDGTWLYYTEKEADEMFYERCTCCEMNWLQARLVRRAVILFGDYDVDQTSNGYKWNAQWLWAYNHNVI